MRILAVGAHPDDIEFGCGGALIKRSVKGDDISMLVLTDGGRGGDPAERRREQEAARTFLGAQQLFWGGYQDTEVHLQPDLIQRIEEIIHQTKPDVIFVQYGDDTHQDHRHLSTSVVTASRYTRNILFYEGPTTQHFTPSVFVDIEGVLEQKLDALSAHTSQIAKTGVDGLSILDLARATSHFRGLQGRVRNAEAFAPLRLFLDEE